MTDCPYDWLRKSGSQIKAHSLALQNPALCATHIAYCAVKIDKFGTLLTAIHY